MSEDKQEQYIIDPNADTIIILKNPGLDFAVWEEAEEALASQNGENVGVVVEPEPQPAIEDEPPTIPEEEAIAVLEEEPLSMVPDRMEGPSGTSSSAFKTQSVNVEPGPEQQHHQTDTSASTTNTDQELEGAVVYHVSSRHLALSSGYFGKALSKTWPEGQSSESDGLYRLYAEDWDPEAFLILLNVLHLRNRQVPQAVTLEMLAKLAVLVDYYRCQEAIEVFSRIWIDGAKTKYEVPSQYSRDLILWIWVAWVFKLDDVFQSATKVALKHCKTPVMNILDLPIPTVITSELEIRRYQLLENIVSTCHSWIDKFRDGYQCPKRDNYGNNSDGRNKLDYYCSAVLLGALIKETDRLGFYSPRPEVPFAGLSIEAVQSHLKGIVSPGWCSTIESNGYDGYGRYRSQTHSCTLQNTVIPGIDTLVSGITGLYLEQFRDRAYET